MQPYFRHLARMDPLVFLRTLSGSESTAWTDLEAMDRGPTLVVAAGHDKFTPLWLSSACTGQSPE